MPILTNAQYFYQGAMEPFAPVPLTIPYFPWFVKGEAYTEKGPHDRGGYPIQWIA